MGFFSFGLLFCKSVNYYKMSIIRESVYFKQKEWWSLHNNFSISILKMMLNRHSNAILLLMYVTVSISIMCYLLATYFNIKPKWLPKKRLNYTMKGNWKGILLLVFHLVRVLNHWRHNDWKLRFIIINYIKVVTFE